MVIIINVNIHMMKTGAARQGAWGEEGGRPHHLGPRHRRGARREGGGDQFGRGHTQIIDKAPTY